MFDKLNNKVFVNIIDIPDDIYTHISEITIDLIRDNNIPFEYEGVKYGKNGILSDEDKKILNDVVIEQLDVKFTDDFCKSIKEEEISEEDKKRRNNILNDLKKLLKKDNENE